MRALMVLALLLLATSTAHAEPASAASGTHTLAGKQSLDATEPELTDAYKQGLKNAGADDATVAALEKGGAIARAVRQIKRQKTAPRADTFVFYTEGPDNSIRKWTVTLLPGDYPDEKKKTVTPIHEEGHAQIDRAAVDAVNKAKKEGTLPAVTQKQIVDLLQIYENAGNRKFHEVFGNSPGKTDRALEETGLDPKGLRDRAVEEGRKAGAEALDRAIAGLGHGQRPVLKSMLPDAAAAGTTVFVTGEHFGTNRDNVTVWFADCSAKPLTVRDTSLAVNVPEDTPAACEVQVQVGSQLTEPCAFTLATDPPAAPSPKRIRVRLSVGKNPVGVGETTTGTFTVENTDRRVRIHFVNRSPAVVEFVGGNEQTVTTSGGATNTATFTIRGIAGPRTYNVDYDWRLTEDL